MGNYSKYNIDWSKVNVNYNFTLADINGIYKEYKLLKLENQTSASVELSFNKLAYYNGDCSNCNEDENHVNIKLSPTQVLEGECSSNNDLKVFIKMNNNIKTRTLTDFSLSEVIVTKL